MKSGFTAVDTNSALARVLLCSSCLGEDVGFDFAYKCFLLPQNGTEQVAVSKNVSTLKINPANTLLVSLLYQ